MYIECSQVGNSRIEALKKLRDDVTGELSAIEQRITSAIDMAISKEEEQS